MKRSGGAGQTSAVSPRIQQCYLPFPPSGSRGVWDALLKPRMAVEQG